MYDQKEYDAAAVDIWSLAIIFCCMSLRRFPWKLPRMTDNSFKLFASDPTPGHDPKKLIVATPSATPSSANLSALSTGEAEQRYKSQQSSTNSSATTPATTDSKPLEMNVPPKNEDRAEEKEEHKQHEHKTEHKHEHKDQKPQEGEKKEIIKGPWRILRLLPRYSRHIIHRMLELDPQKRAKMEEILEDLWVADTVICQQLENGEVLAAEDHTHVLEPPNNQSS